MTRITSTTKLCALIGYPVKHSLSPAMHNAAFQHLGLNYVYLCFQVKPRSLEAGIRGVKALDIVGLNVTIPHKVAAMRYLDEVEPLAEEIGAVNTVANVGGRLVGYNTDGLGGLRALEEGGVAVRNMKVAILGAGGASRALSFSITPLASSIVILNRTEEKALKLASRLRSRFKKDVRGVKLTQDSLEEELKDVDVLINTTSVGMHPRSGECLVKRSHLNSRMTVFDIVYNPVKTRLLRMAERVGAKTVSGLSMLVHQGALSFEIWTGVKPPIEVMFRAVEEALEGE